MEIADKQDFDDDALEQVERDESSSQDKATERQVGKDSVVKERHEDVEESKDTREEPKMTSMVEERKVAELEKKQYEYRSKEWW